MSSATTSHRKPSRTVGSCSPFTSAEATGWEGERPGRRGRTAARGAEASFEAQVRGVTSLVVPGCGSASSAPPARAGGCASQAVGSRAGPAPTPPAPPPGPSPPLWRGRARREADPAGESHFPTVGSVGDGAGRRRMEVSLSAVAFYLASASSPVAATTMDQEPGSRAEGGEAAPNSGAAAAAAFRESALQVGGRPGGGGAEAEAGGAQPPRCLVGRRPFGLPGLPPSRPPAGGAFRGSSSRYPRLCSETPAWGQGADASAAGGLSQALRWQRRRLGGGRGFPGRSASFESAKETRKACPREAVVRVAGSQVTPASVSSRPLVVQVPDLTSALWSAPSNYVRRVYRLFFT